MTAQTGMTEDMLQRGFRRFNGNAEVVSALDEVKKKAFVTFQSKSAADKAQQEVGRAVCSAASCVLKHVSMCILHMSTMYVCVVHEMLYET